MAGFLKGHGGHNDELNAPAGRPLAERKGYLGDGEGYEDEDGNIQHIGSSGVNTAADPNWRVDGGGEQVVNGWRQAGTNAWDQDVDRYRSRGAQGYGPLQLDQRHADESRSMQLGSLGMLEHAARGNAPSRAEAVGRLAHDDAMRSSTASLIGKGGPGAAIIGARNAGNVAAQQMGASNLATMDMRAQEMARAQQGFASAAHGVRGQDIQAATTNAQLEAQRRALNESRQQANERMGWDTRHAQMQSAAEWKRQQDQAALNTRRASAAQEAEDDAALKDDINLGLGLGLGILSDERVKKHIVDLGSLGNMKGRY